MKLLANQNVSMQKKCKKNVTIVIGYQIIRENSVFPFVKTYGKQG